MKVPPAATYRSRIANEVASSVVVPKRMAPRLSTLTSRRVFGSVPIVRYLTWSSPATRAARAPNTSLGPGVRSRSNRFGGRCPWRCCQVRRRAENGSVKASAPADLVRGRLGEVIFQRVAGPQGPERHRLINAPGERWFADDRPIRRVH